MLSVHALACVRGERRLFADLGFTLAPHTLLAVRGANGSGKTSLLRMLCGLLSPAAGSIAWNGNDIHSAREEYCAQIAYIGGTLGTLIGADLLHLHRVSGVGAPVVSIGGAGTFGGVSLTGLVSVALVVLTLG